VTPVEVFEHMREKAVTMLQTAFMESGRAWPDDDPHLQTFIRTVLGVGIAAASEHYAEHPEHLAVAGTPICTVCREPVQTLQVGVDPAPNEDSEITKVAWPCGHRQVIT
jgi:hypothetical protein